MIRKISHISIAALLMITTMGFSVSKHYCGTRLIEVSINSAVEPCCGDVGTASCCHDETEYFRFDKDFVSPVIADNDQISDLDILFPKVFVYLFDNTVMIDREILNFAESPPPPNLHTTLSLFQTYLI